MHLWFKQQGKIPAESCSSILSIKLLMQASVPVPENSS
jgi:hypothetical protein